MAHFKIILPTYYLLINRMYTYDLALKSPQGLIYYKTQPNQNCFTTPNIV